MNYVGEILSQNGRSWRGSEPATESEIAELINATDFDWPQELLDLWRFSNGGEGEISLQPMWFVLPRTAEVLQLNIDCRVDGEYKDFQFFGTNGGLETIGLDLRKPSRPIFMIGLIAGEASLEYIAADAREFVKAIGIEYVENA